MCLSSISRGRLASLQISVRMLVSGLCSASLLTSVMCLYMHFHSGEFQAPAIAASASASGVPLDKGSLWSPEQSCGNWSSPSARHILHLTPLPLPGCLGEKALKLAICMLCLCTPNVPYQSLCGQSTAGMTTCTLTPGFWCPGDFRIHSVAIGEKNGRICIL